MSKINNNCNININDNFKNQKSKIKNLKTSLRFEKTDPSWPYLEC